MTNIIQTLDIENTRHEPNRVGDGGGYAASQAEGPGRTLLEQAKDQ
jgi:hypothetical protein